jgi:hypothetical protein
MWKNTYATILQLRPRLLPDHTYSMYISTPPHLVIPPRTYSLHRTMILITPLCYPKTLYWKTVREKADDDILTKEYFRRAHTIERREYETGWIVVGANSSQRWGKERSADDWALDGLLKRASKQSKKISAASSIHACAQSS